MAGRSSTVLKHHFCSAFMRPARCFLRPKMRFLRPSVFSGTRVKFLITITTCSTYRQSKVGQKVGSYCELTTSWELWKHPDPVPGGRPIFFKLEWPKESKNGSKTMSCRPPLLLIFSNNCFSAKKIVEKIGRFVDFWFFMAIYMNKLDQF